MHIIVQRHLDAGMSQNFTQRFNVHSCYNTARGKSMTQRMKIYIGKLVELEIAFEAVLIGSGLDKATGTRKKI